jgi:hypothetical protein
LLEVNNRKRPKRNGDLSNKKKRRNSYKLENNRKNFFKNRLLEGKSNSK